MLMSTIATTFYDMGLEKIKHGESGLEQNGNPLEEKEVPDNPGYVGVNIIIAKKADEPLEHKGYHGDVAVIDLLGDDFHFGVALGMGEAEHFVEYSHVGHDGVHAAVIFAG